MCKEVERKGSLSVQGKGEGNKVHRRREIKCAGEGDKVRQEKEDQVCRGGR